MQGNEARWQITSSSVVRQSVYDEIEFKLLIEKIEERGQCFHNYIVF